MITSLQAKFPSFTPTVTSSQHIYIVDLKNINGGGVTLFETNPAHHSVNISNPAPVPVIFIPFPDNAFAAVAGQGIRNCECVLFPEACNDNDWVLFIETKYVENMENAFREERGYPRNMIAQIISTVQVFRDLGIIKPDRRVSAIVSFPTLIEDFSAFFFTGQKSVDDILQEHRILIRATNSATINTPKRIKLTTV